jgi:hypothetical protein
MMTENKVGGQVKAGAMGKTAQAESKHRSSVIDAVEAASEAAEKCVQRLAALHKKRKHANVHSLHENNGQQGESRDRHTMTPSASVPAASGLPLPLRPAPKRPTAEGTGSNHRRTLGIAELPERLLTRDKEDESDRATGRSAEGNIHTCTKYKYTYLAIMRPFLFFFLLNLAIITYPYFSVSLCFSYNLSLITNNLKGNSPLQKMPRGTSASIRLSRNLPELLQHALESKKIDLLRMAEGIFSDELQRMEEARQGRDDAETLTLKNDVALLQFNQDKFDEAVSLHRRYVQFVWPHRIREIYVSYSEFLVVIFDT